MMDGRIGLSIGCAGVSNNPGYTVYSIIKRPGCRCTSSGATGGHTFHDVHAQPGGRRGSYFSPNPVINVQSRKAEVSFDLSGKLL